MTKESPEKAEAFHARERDVFIGIYAEKGSIPDNDSGNGDIPIHRDPGTRKADAYSERPR